METIIEAFRELDSRGYRRLSVADLLAFQGAKFTPLFLHRFFEERVVKTSPRSNSSGMREMDLEKFSEFVIAWRDKGSMVGIRYFFPVFDVEKKGYLTRVDIHMFFKEVIDMIGECQQVGVHALHFIVLVGSNDSYRSTGQQLGWVLLLLLQ